MSTANINIRMDSDLKKRFAAFCDDIGMSMTTAFNVFARQAVRENKIPFEIDASPQTNQDTLDAMQEVAAMKKDPSKIGKTYDNVDEMFDDILK